MTAPETSTAAAKKKNTPTIGGAVSWALGARYFNPKSWVAAPGYQRGAVVKTAWANLRKTWHIKRADEARHESFDVAIERLGLTPVTLAMRRKEFCLGSRICYATALAVLAISGYQAVQGNFAGGVGGLALCVVGAYCGYVRAFRAWQIDQREFAPFSKFFFVIEAWFI